ncbi:hypothetical protein CEXT_741971 [Caerostris extrusa]|uniref:Uncharacterized protein n=1 Tax=Caerostris extrusa TaxID=172846 RepID=A0AAV4X3U1_CAEEX|nr:hypothetical protein CEXT_741971 [Caerostris extrusa]
MFHRLKNAVNSLQSRLENNFLCSPGPGVTLPSSPRESSRPGGQHAEPVVCQEEVPRPPRQARPLHGRQPFVRQVEARYLVLDNRSYPEIAILYQVTYGRREHHGAVQIIQIKPAFKEENRAEGTDLCRVAVEEGGQTCEPHGAAVHRHEVPPCFVGAEAVAPGGTARRGRGVAARGAQGSIHDQVAGGVQEEQQLAVAEEGIVWKIIMFEDKFVAEYLGSRALDVAECENSELQLHRRFRVRRKAQCHGIRRPPTGTLRPLSR